ncbi:MAG: tetratricopeptide repeat protein [Proteobacteria bacterium]|jgi:tetratricopeptide (TPR) repeat protein|nr:tetratricopeptide repeat protein [Pseudomonadota bacterium]
MSKEKPNTCARCGVPIKPNQLLCNVCKAEATERTSIVPCLACGAANPSRAATCEACGAPLGSAHSPTEPTPEELPADAFETALEGRQAELRVLMDCFDVCVENSTVGGTIVTGETGMGVSTLLDAFAERLTGRIPKNRIFHVHCHADDDLFGPIRGLLRLRLREVEEEDPMTTRLKLTNFVGHTLGAGSAALVTETAHLLGYLANMPFPDSPVLRALESDQALLLKRVQEAVVRFLIADAVEGPAVFILDALHHATPESRALQLDVLNALGSIPLMVAMGGTEEIQDITDNPSVVRVRLEPLDDDVLRQLFRNFLPRLVDPPEELVQATIDRVAGNPGSLKQLCALLTETGVVDTSSEPWKADLSKLSMADMPVKVIDALKARLKRLDPRDRSVIKCAAIVGEVFWDEAVVALTRVGVRLKEDIGAGQIWADDSDAFTISSSLARLVERQFIVQLPDQDIEGSIKFAFARSGIRDDIRGEVDPAEAEKLNYLVAEWFSHASAKSGPRFAREEAEHWEAAGEKRRAALAYINAARDARQRHLNQKTIQLFQKGLSLADERDRVVIVDALHDLGSVHELLGQYEAAELYYTEMLRHAWILVHRGKAGAALNKIGRLYRARGDAAAARAFLDRGMALFKAAGDEKGVAACLGDLGELARRQGSYDRAFKLLNQALAIQRKLDNRPSIAVCLHSLGHVEAARGAYAQAERFLEEALELRRAAGDKGGMAHTMSALAIVLFNRGDLERAIARWEAALSLAEEVGDRRMMAILNNNLGEALRDQGKLDDSMRHFKACEQVVTTLDDRLLHSEVSRNIGILSQKMSDFEAARLQLERSLMLAKEVGGRELEGLALRALGELAATTMWDTSNVEAEDEAITYFEKALVIFRAIGNEFEVARSLHAYGNRLLERGDVNGGRAKLEEARNIFHRIQSKAGDKVARTISEIIRQPANAAEAAAERRKSVPPAAAAPREKKREAIPDMTDDLETRDD